MLSSRIVVVLSVGLFFAVTASASPVNFDGNFDSGDSYYATLDDVNEAGIQDDLDIKSVGFDLYGGYFWIGLGVWDGPLATDGGMETIWGQTLFYNVFETGTGTDRLKVTLDEGDILEVNLNGSVLTDGVDYEAVLGPDAVNGGLEIKIIDSLLSPLNFNYYGQLDDTGLPSDDNVTGDDIDVPEPMTLALMALGLPLLLIRRRR